MAQTVNTNSALLTSGFNQYFSIADASQTGLELGAALTIEAWVKIVSFIDGIQAFVAKYKFPTDKGYDFSVQISSGVPTVRLSLSGTGSDNETISYTSSISSNKWSHVAVTWNGSTKAFVFYENGVQVSSSTGTVVSSVFSNAADFGVGASQAGGGSFGRYFLGKLDDVRVWNVVRTAKQIADNYSQELVGNESGLVGYWKFNDVATDSTSNANNLTANNGATYSSPKQPAFWGRPGGTGGGARSFSSYGY